jgi:hypothetical protein
MRFWQAVLAATAYTLLIGEAMHSAPSIALAGPGLLPGIVWSADTTDDARLRRWGARSPRGT